MIFQLSRFTAGSKARKRRILRKLLSNPFPGNPSTQGKRNCCGYNVPGEYDEKSPPQPEEKTATDGQHTSGQKENVTRRKKQWITNRSPWAPRSHTLL